MPGLGRWGEASPVAGLIDALEQLLPREVMVDEVEGG